MAAHEIIHEGVDAAIGGGVESITASAKFKARSARSRSTPGCRSRSPGIYMVMGDTAEVVAKRYKISREAQDQYALSSQQRTARAQRGGLLRRRAGPDAGHAGHPRQEDRRDRRPGGASARQGRVQPSGHDAGGTAGAEAVLRSEERPGDRDGGQLVAALRRRLGHAAHGTPTGRAARHQAEGRLPRVRRRRLRAGRDGHRPRVRRAQAAQAATA